MNRKQPSPWWAAASDGGTPRRWLRRALMLGILSVAGCGFDVVNPGPVEDSFLNHPGAHAAIVNGMHRTTSDAMNRVGHLAAVMAREIYSVGSTQRFGVPLTARSGKLDPRDISAPWANAQRARWVSEHGVERLREVRSDFETSPLVAQALTWVGFANRLLGENMCLAIIDGGPPQDRSIHFDRAEKAFTEAIQIARAAADTKTELAALAGRASVRVWLEKWSDAAADAAAVPKGFVFQAKMGTQGDGQYNYIAWANADAPYRFLSIGPWFRDYNTSTGDPRVAWLDSKKPANIPSLGPWQPPLKYNDRDDPINLASGREMLLVRAEARLAAQQDVLGALELINELRADVRVASRATLSLEEAWLFLKMERGVELYLESRRMGDVWRWKQEGTPGVEPANLDPGKNDLCYPPSQSEVDSNPNLR
ncbi:MAG: RagB/SusD family nutrient uptake outer membrane protein [Gemmatimonadetes bacterium]|nr:RagB/SusD family nutrient uptake outer membrane protein [Gemmatimonadota bacterium]